MGGIGLSSKDYYGDTIASSLGFTAIDSAGNYGVVMSGHAVKGVDTWVTQGLSIGQVTIDPCCTRKSDAAFVKTNTTTDLKGQVYGGYAINIHYISSQIATVLQY